MIKYVDLVNSDLETRMDHLGREPKTGFVFLNECFPDVSVSGFRK